MKINMDSIRKKIVYSDPVQKAMENVAKKETFAATAIASKEFADSDITKEVDAGPNSSNISGLLGGYGNLYSFFGLDSNPIPDLKKLWTTVKFKGLNNIQIFGRKAVYSYKVNIPSPIEFESESQLPWMEEGSWLIRVTRGGVSGLGQYIRRVGAGRSTGGIQLKKKMRQAKMKTAPYFVQIYNTFLKAFKGGEKV